MEPDYTQFTALDFAQEPSFIRWVRQQDEQASRFWQDWLLQHPEQATLIADARRLVQALRVKEQEPPAAQLEQLWQRIAREVDAAPVARRVPLRPWRVVATLAAAVALILMGTFFFRTATTIRAAGGERVAYTLPDQSSFTLNADSKVTFQKRGWPHRRTLQLDGEAFFKVTKGDPFTVITPAGTVEVLGTEFNVKVRQNTFAVACMSGKVRVKSGNQIRVLTAGEATQWNETRELSPDFAIDPQLAGGWRQGKFDFKNVPLEEIFEEIQRQFGVTIRTTPAIAARRVDRFFTTTNLDSALYRVCWPSNLTVVKQGKVIIIK